MRFLILKISVVLSIILSLILLFEDNDYNLRKKQSFRECHILVNNERQITRYIKKRWKRFWMLFQERLGGAKVFLTLAKIPSLAVEIVTSDFGISSFYRQYTSIAYSI